MAETVASIKEKLAVFAAEFSSALSRVQADVENLKSKIPPGGSITITQSDLDGIGGGLDSAIAMAKALDPDPAFPPAPPNPTEPPA